MASNEKNNSASRARWILVNALHQGDSVKTLDAWYNVLIDRDEEPRSFEVIRLVEALRKEIENAERQLERQGVPDSLYKKHFQDAYKVTDPTNLTTGWGKYKKFIKPELLVCFSFAAYLIEENEPTLPDEELEQVEKLLAELKTQLVELEIDSSLLHFVQEQVALLERGLQDLNIRGAKALQKCYVDGIGEIFENEKIIIENSESPIISKLKEVWTTFQGTTNKAATINKSIDTWSKVVEKGTVLIDGITKLL